MVGPRRECNEGLSRTYRFSLVDLDDSTVHVSAHVPPHLDANVAQTAVDLIGSIVEG